ncbi:hypothetical protein SETIT_5G283100v2 [Setaria italica]|uniref:Uncharacterized protein n=2 Tax=Setaria TaxID=4554 RepID=A0A368R9L9_SETIT|nr:hypothetical protein SETIT_5G283100v2 [Setaria italica]TKW16217.1 hypothetical protein SEVIR_5G285700v2 [Setaria viridis]
MSDPYRLLSCSLDRSSTQAEAEAADALARSRSGRFRAVPLESRGALGFARGAPPPPPGGKGSVGVVGALRAPVCCVSGNGRDSAAISVVDSAAFLPSRRVASHRVVSRDDGHRLAHAHALPATRSRSEQGVIVFACPLLGL